MSHVFFGFKGFFRKGEDLVEAAIKGDEVFFDQCVSGKEVVIQGESKKCSDFMIAVIGQAVSIGCKE